MGKNNSSHPTEFHVPFFFSPRVSSPILSPTKPGHPLLWHLEISCLGLSVVQRLIFLLPGWPNDPSGIAKAFQWRLGAPWKSLRSQMRSELRTPALPWERERINRPLLWSSPYRKEDSLQTLSRQNFPLGKLARTHSGRTGHFLPPRSKFF